MCCSPDLGVTLVLALWAHLVNCLDEQLIWWQFKRAATNR